MAPRSLIARLDDILDNIRNARAFIEDKSLEQFRGEQITRLAVERTLEIISEASWHIPDTIKSRYPEIPWSKVKAIGNVLRHAYQRVDADLIWTTAKDYLEPLRRAVEAIKTQEIGIPAAMKPETRIDQRFAAVKAQGRAALVTFVTAGDPDFETSRKILLGLPKAGADVIEIGMPFSDPMADGPAIQASSLRALKSGQTMKKTLALVAEFRQQDAATPIVLMGYFNPIYVYPAEAFLKDAAAAGVDGLIVVDLPPEADDELCLPAIKHGLSFIRLATPTTNDKRLPAVLANTSGFVYYVSIAGITGTKAPDVSEVHAQVARIKRKTKLPVAVGFGVKTPEQARDIARGADGVVVGSALVDQIANNLDCSGKAGPKTAEALHQLVANLAAALRA